MGPTRTHIQGGDPSSSHVHSNSRTPTHKHKPKRKTHEEVANGSAVPGVQKIKAALRQTRRLLAKDKLAADVRVETERRQKALEADLVKAERVRKERTLAQKYHKVKFFERQKVTRKLNQVKRDLETCTEKKEKKKLEKTLFELRVDLNYILHYPKLQKYISLFPPEVRQQSDDAKGKQKESEAEKAELAQTDIQREEIRKSIRERMESGSLSLEPEAEDRQARTAKHQDSLTSGITKTKGEDGKGRKKHVPDIQEDAFFGDDSDADAGEEQEGSDDEDVDMDS